MKAVDASLRIFFAHRNVKCNRCRLCRCVGGSERFDVLRRKCDVFFFFDAMFCLDFV